MALQGFSVPRSPLGRATLTPEPPWFYAGNLLVVDFEADPAALAAVLPTGLVPDPADPGGCTVFFVDWQYAGAAGEERTDPVRGQYHECLLLVNASYDGAPVSTCPYIYVDKDTSMARGWIQGWPKRLGEVHTTRAFPLASPAAPVVGPGESFAASLSANGRRLAEATVTLSEVSANPVVLGSRPIVNVRYFPQLASSAQRRPAVHELVRSVLTGGERTDVWQGDATLEFFPAPDAELHALAPVAIRGGYRYSTAFRIEDLEILEPVAASALATA